MKKLGYTLAETLLVLAIIGVIASLTIPALQAGITDIKRRSEVQIVTNALSNAAELAANDNGGTLQGLQSNFLTSYLQTIDSATGIDAHLGLIQVTLMDGTPYPEVWNYTKYALANGAIIMPRMLFPNCDYAQQDMTDICGDVVVDMDGAKGAQVVGRDVYYFWITKTGIHANRTDSPTDKFPIYGVYANTCSKGSTGWSCSGNYITGSPVPN